MRVKSLILATFLVLFFTSCNDTSKDEGINVTFELNSPDLSNDSTVYITGSIPQLGNWDPSAVPMENRGDHKWSVTIAMNSPGPVEYKYTLGNWDREAAGENGLPLQNSIARIEKETTMQDDVFFWLDGPVPEFPGKVTGKVKYHYGIKGEGLADRDLIVWLPPGYEEDTGNSYPVLYMHDGQNLFDPATSSFGVDWQVDETCDSLIRNGEIRPLIVVGINNTPDRTGEYGPGSKGAEYMAFLVNTVKPFIDNEYRTRPDRENTLVGGSSMGGIISFRLVWKYPGIFSMAICMSPAFKIGRLDYVKRVKRDRGNRRDILLYIDNGGIGLEEELQPGIDDMLLQLNRKGYAEGSDYIWIIDPEARHFESAWAARMPQALRLLIPAIE